MISLALVPNFINCTYDLYILKKNKFNKLLFLKHWQCKEYIIILKINSREKIIV